MSKKIITIVAALLLVAATAGIVIAVTASKDPKTRVVSALGNFANQLTSKYYRTDKKYRTKAEKAFASQIGYTGSLKLEGLDVDIPQISEIASYISGIKLRSEGTIDIEENRIHSETGIAYAIISLPYLTIDVNGSEVALSAEDVFDGALTLETKGMGTAFNASDLSRIFGVQLSDEKVAMLDQGLPTDSDASDPDTKMTAKALDALKDFYDAIEVEETEEKREIFIDGKVLKCDLFRIKAKEEDINKLISELGLKGANAKEDCLMEAAITPKGNLAYFNAAYGDYVLDAEIRSEECARNDMNIMFGKMNGATVELICRGTEDKNTRHDDLEMKLSLGKRELNLTTSFDTNMDNYGIGIDASDISISTGGRAIYLSGDMDLIFDAEEPEPIPEPRRELLKMSEADFDKLGVEIYDHLMQNDMIAMVLSQFGGEPVVGDLLDLMNSGR